MKLVLAVQVVQIVGTAKKKRGVGVGREGEERLLNFARFTIQSPKTRVTVYHPKFLVKSPEILFVQQHPHILIALVSFHQIFKKKIYYLLEVLVSFPQG